MRHRLALTALALLAALASLDAQPRTDPRLLEAIRWYTGEAGSIDEARARLLVEASAFEGDVLSRMWLARAYSRGRMGYPRDGAKAQAIALELAEAVRRQAVNGNVEAQFLMGTIHDEGLGVPEDPVEAMVWFQKAAASGHTLAEHNIGNAFAAGRGVPADPANAATAVTWWLKAAAKGDAVPQFRLGEAYEHGRGVAVSQAEARRWYGEAAVRGNAAAAAAVKRLGAGR